METGLASNHLIRVIIYVSSIASMPPSETTIAEMLKNEAGYATGLIGKWHLGINCESEDACSDPNGQGFDYFYGLPLTNLKDCGHGSVWQVWRSTVYRDIFLAFFAVVAGAIYLRMNGFIGKNGFRVIVTFATILTFSLYFMMKTMGHELHTDGEQEGYRTAVKLR
ncbi:putative steryl-sulfatase [Apostichopus japonicus]|uniref:Putative steryl-sulfatase n=1 Tax=Stichopus japonicus TaxID=307972 RepID=A0A2G8LB77_STIJA|nr:putative steryl-sulfatase [Apostichopus japonicus]